MVMATSIATGLNFGWKPLLHEPMTLPTSIDQYSSPLYYCTFKTTKLVICLFLLPLLEDLVLAAGVHVAIDLLAHHAKFLLSTHFVVLSHLGLRHQLLAHTGRALSGDSSLLSISDQSLQSGPRCVTWISIG